MTNNLSTAKKIQVQLRNEKYLDKVYDVFCLVWCPSVHPHWLKAAIKTNTVVVMVSTSTSSFCLSSLLQEDGTSILMGGKEPATRLWFADPVDSILS